MVTANPLRMAALVQGYPVRKPFALTDAGDLQLWLDASDPGTLQNSSGSASSYPTRWLDQSDGSLINLTRWNTNTASTVSGSAYDDMVQVVPNAKNSRSVVRIRTVGSASSFEQNLVVRGASSAAKAKWNFLHTEESHLFLVFRPYPSSGSPFQGRYGRDMKFGRTAGNMRWITSWSPEASLEPGVSLSARMLDGNNAGKCSFGHAIYRSVANSYVAVLDAPTTSLAADQWSLLYLRSRPTASTAGDRVVAQVGGSTFASNTYTSAPSSADCSTSLSMEFSGGGSYSPIVDIGEYAIFRGAMAGSGAQLVLAYLRAKWNV